MEKITTEGITTKKIFAIAVPLILQQLSLQMQIWVDRAMLGHVDSQYFSAVGNVLVPYYAVTAIITAICGGTTILIAQNIGAKNELHSKNYAECSFIGNSIFPLIAFLIFFCASDFMFTLMGVQSPILEYSTSYIRILAFTLLILGPVSTSVSVMQGIGITKIIMFAGLISNALNILLDWVLIFGKFGFPQMNIEGAALASVISNYVTAPIMILYVFLNKNIPFRLEIKKIFSFRWNLYKNILKIGIPSGLETMLWNIGTLLVISFLNRLDIMAVGIFTLIFSIETLPLFLYMGFANAALTLVGHKTGEDNQKQAVGVGFRCLRFSLVICVIFAALFVIFPKGIIRLFTNDLSLIGYAAPFLMFVSITIFPRSINNVIGLGIRGTGDTRWMLYGQMVGTVLVITLSYLLIFPAGLGLWGIFITLLIDETVRGIINLLRFWKGREFFFLKPFEKVIIKK
jgi:putative MATE family efflux protein